MPRTSRKVEPTGIYHIIANGNSRTIIFHDSIDRYAFLELLRQEVKNKTISVHHYALMDSHIHLMLQAHELYPISVVMKRLLQGFTLHHMKRYGHKGHLWRDRFKSFIIDTDRYLLTCGIYIELNPVRAGICKNASDSKWTSHTSYLKPSPNSFITPSPAFLALGSAAPERKVAYASLTRMWGEHAPSKRDVKRFFNGGAKKGQSPFV